MPRHSDNTWLERISGYLQSQTGVKNGSVAGNPAVQNVGGVYYLSPQTFADGQQVIAHYDANGNLLVSLATTIAGEDLTNDVLKVNQVFTYKAVTAADAQVKAGAGFLHCITFSCNDAAPTVGSIIVFDSLTETGTQIFNHTFTITPFLPFTVFFDCIFSTGLYLGFTTTADVNVSVSYR